MQGGELTVVDQLGQWSWSGLPQNLEEYDDVEHQQEEVLCEDLEEEAIGKFSLSRLTISKPIHPGSSSSGRTYHSTQRSIMEYSKPTMSIRSHHSLYSITHAPPQQLQVQSHLKWIPRAPKQQQAPRLSRSQSRAIQERPSPPHSSGVKIS
ncbi:P4 protein [Wheat leaf yellowing-associated virus]|uniref:P4 protein n=1 Tax=Wheat leaf yellowing-associated virus TaxID=2019445 RepID=A0A220T7N5_9VIRU|nr:P4 protein [Wheat leaf yellowing-associated virus]ASK51774.1 P4 protein [Wheat leaf yellowing-associated virus]WBK56468.1 movement protein [Wheat leaf yellowing-associated virus]